MDEDPWGYAFFVGDGECPLRFDRRALREEDDDTSDQTRKTSQRHGPQEHLMWSTRNHDACQQCHDSQLRNTKGHDTKRKSKNCPKDSALDLVHGESVEVSTVSKACCFDRTGNSYPLQDLLIINH